MARYVKRIALFVWLFVVIVSVQSGYAQSITLQKLNKADFFADKNQVNQLIDNTLAVGQRERVNGLIDFSFERYKEAVSGKLPVAHAVISAKMSWHSMSWAKILLSHDKLASREQIADIDGSLPIIGKLFGWNNAQTDEMFKLTRGRFNERIK